MKKKISAVLAVSIIASNISPAINVYANEVVKEKARIIEENAVNQAKITAFNLSNYSNYDNYNAKFRVLRDEIKSISNNGGQYASSTIDKAIDGNISTHWETGKQNSSDFKNEVVVEFNNVESIDRIAYATRQDSAKGKGYPTQFEIYSSITGDDEDFKLVSTGEHSSTGNMMEFKFDTVTTKKIKFVFKEANQNWASASEFWFYREDKMIDKINSLFTDSNMNVISEEFNTTDKLNELEEEVKFHPFYEDFKEYIDNAKIILGGNKIESTQARVSKLVGYGTDKENEYDAEYMMPNSNISKIEANGGTYYNSKLDYMIDGKTETHWETNRNNDENFTNELIFTLDEAKVLDRVAFLARENRKGFPEEFVIYASETTKGDTFQLVSSGEATSTNDFLEFKFEPTKFKRIKFKFKRCVINRPFVAEMRFYKQDSLTEKFNNLFTNDSKNTVSEEFNTLEKLSTLENELKSHPMYDLYKEDIDNAKILLTKDSIEATTALTRAFEHYTNEAYNERFKIDRSKIKKISTNGGHYVRQVIENAIDDNLDTYWETSKANTSTFNNEVEVEFNETVEINRIAYGARKSDRKGFAEEFEIYGSKTSKGDTYELVATGKYNTVSGLVEAKFETNEFKRIKFKFKKSNQNWASLSEIAFYKEDKLSDKIDNLFTNNLMNELSEEFNTLEKLTALENEVNSHPAADTFKEKIEIAKEVLTGKQKTTKVITLEQRGDMSTHARQNLRIPLGNNNLPTGISATPGETIVVYVEPAGDGTVPSLLFTQHEASYAKWGTEVKLKPGKNVIEVPSIGADLNITKGGPIYLRNPYTAKQQGKAPVVRFEGGQLFPMATKDTDPEEFKQFLEEYKLKMDEDKEENPNVKERKVVDVVEIVSDHIVFTGTASEAYNQFVLNDKNPLDTIEGYDYMMNKVFLEYGLDGRSEIHDPKNIRENIRLMQPYGAMYAASDHTGIQRGTVAHMLSDFRKVNPGWGIIHEIGHRMAVSEREYGEVTNNMLAMAMSIEWNQMDTRIPFETIYKYVIEENKVSMTDVGLFDRLGAFWQLELAHPGYWTELNSLYRERKVTLTNGDNSKQQYLVKFSSEVLGVDLSSHFARHGFTVNSETREELKAKYPASNKVWYLNNSLVGYKGNGISDKNAKIETSISQDKTNNSNIIEFNIDNEYTNDLLGYEVYRDGELIGFTSTNKFTDTEINTDENYTYTIVAYDKKLNTLNPLDMKAFKPSLSTEKKVTLKLNEKFTATDYVKATSYDGNDITDRVVVKSNNVNTSKKGEYTVVFEISDNDAIETKTMSVSVVSDYDYLSDYQWNAVETQWGTPRRNSNIKGRVNGVVKDFEKGFGIHANGKITYDLSDKDYDRFEALLGVDMGIASQNNSSITFKVVGDGKTLATTKVLKHADDMAYINVDVNGVEELVIEVHDGGNGNTSDHAVIANPKLTTNNAKPKLTAEDKTYKLGEEIDFMAGVAANDAEDGNLTSSIEIASNTYEENKTGRFEVVYRVTDSDNNTSEKKSYITVYEDFVVKKSKYGQFDNLAKYNEQFKLNIASVSNNAGNYPGSVIGNSIDNNINTHWETNSPNSDTFKNEVVFDLGENQEISTIAYSARRSAGGKGFANKFEIYVSNEAEGDDFILAGKGEYSGSTTDVIEFNISKTTARRVKFKFIEANQNWASIGEMSFYKEDTLANKINNNLFTDNTKTKVSDDYNTLEKLEALREEVKAHPAAKLFEDDLNKAEEIIRSSFPVLNIPKSISTKVGQTIDIYGKYSATDKEDGDITSDVKVSGKVNFNKTGKYTITYTVTDSDDNKVSEKRTIAVVNMDDYKYLTDYDWKSTTNSYRSPNKDKSMSNNALRLTDENSQEVVYERGIGAHSTSTIIYDLTEKDYAYFTSYVGVDRAMYGSVGSVSFEVYVDGEKKFDSGLMNSRDPQKYVEVDINDAKELKLVVTDGGNGQGSDHATWGDTKLHFANTEETNYKELEKLVAKANEYDKELYTEESFEIFEEALNKANAILEDKISSQEEVDSMVEELNSAIENLEENIDLNEVVNIKDKYLKSSIKKELNLSSDVITVGDMLNLTKLKAQGAESLEGLQYAKNLQSLNIEYNEINDLSPLKNLKKLTDLRANYQIISAGMAYKKDNKVTIDYDVINRKGEKLSPTNIIVRNNKTLEETSLNVDDCIDENGVISFDTTDFEEYTHSVYLVYEDSNDNYIGQVLFMFNNR